MLPYSQFKTLDDILAEAARYAEFCMRKSGRMTPTLFLICPGGPLIFVPENLEGQTDKDEFANTSRLICIAHAATACVLAMEVWAKFAQPGERLDETEPPSESFDRREFVTFMGEDRAVQKQIFLPIIRSGNGRFFGFNDAESPDMNGMTGRFAQILSPKAPGAQMQLLAITMLNVKGVKTIKLAPQKPRARC